MLCVHSTPSSVNVKLVLVRGHDVEFCGNHVLERERVVVWLVLKSVNNIQMEEGLFECLIEMLRTSPWLGALSLIMP